MNKLFLRIPKKDITLLTKIIESYDNLGVVSTVDPAAGLVIIHLTPDTRETILAIVSELSFVQEILEKQGEY